MVTALGKFFRKLRIDNSETLKVMSEKLGVSASFLSAVENGKKRMPSEWNKLICEFYSFSLEQSDGFSDAIAKSEESINMKLSDIPTQNRATAVSLVRKFSDFNEKQIEELKILLSESKNNKERKL